MAAFAGKLAYAPKIPGKILPGRGMIQEKLVLLYPSSPHVIERYQIYTCV